MAVPLPYLVSYKNLPTLFEKISSAKIPDKFTHAFLATTLGIKGTNDRAFIPLLRNLGFLDQSGTPLPAYRLLKGDNSRAALADGIRKAYAPLFDSNQDAHTLPPEKLKSLVAQIAGTDSDLTSRIANTFLALTKNADFTANPTPLAGDKKDEDEEEERQDERQDQNGRVKLKGLRTDFHYDIHVHLPSNGTEETYLNIFNAIRKTFQ
jgi:hypothetical protein